MCFSVANAERVVPSMLCANGDEDLVHHAVQSPNDPCRQEYHDCIRGRRIALVLRMAAHDEHQSRRGVRHPRCRAPRLSEKGPRNERECHGDSGNHKPDIGLAGNLFAGRVKSHVSSIAVQAPIHVCSA